MILGDSMAFLCISLNSSSVNAVHLLDGELSEIDKYTVKFETPKDILKEYPEKIDEFNHIYNVEDDDIKLRIFLPDDKERFVMYKKNLIAAKLLMKNRSFLKYVLTYEDNLLEKKYRDLINDDNATDKEVLVTLKEYLASVDEAKYYDFMRRICYQYNNYLEDHENEKLPSIDIIYRNYLKKVKEGKLSQTSEVVVQKKKEVQSPFAVFEHPNFFKKFGKAIDKKRPVFIFGGKITKKEQNEYVELYNNCQKCFENPIYYPLNANVSIPLNKEFASIYSHSILVVINGNDYNKDLEQKIMYANQKGITVLILTSDEHLEQIYKKHFEGLDTVIIRDYQYGNYDSLKMFADIIAGLYINEYKKQAR